MSSSTRSLLASAVLFLLAAGNAFAVSPDLVISQIYGAGGNTGATWKNDYIEIFNRGTSAVSLNGKSVQYASSSGTGNFGGAANQITVLPNVTVQPGAYYLIQESGGTTGTAIPNADLVVSTNPINMSGTAGKVAIVSSTSSLGCNGGSTPCSSTQLAQIIDLVGFGTGTNFFEGTVAPAPSATNAIFRAGAGCTDTDVNSADFAAAAAVPRYSGTALNVCSGGGGNTAPTIGAIPAVSVFENTPPFDVQITGSDDGGIYNWTATTGTGVTAVNVTAGSTSAVVTYTVTIASNFTGTATFTAQLSDNVNPPVTKAVNISVLAPPPPPDHIVISQVYGSGGNPGTYANDYVELFNPTASPINVTGWTLQYASDTSTFFSQTQPIGGTIGAGEYYLVQLGSGGSGGAAFPTPPGVNVVGSINISGSSGKLALVSNSFNVSGDCASMLSDPDVVDFVGYGTGANCSEGPTKAPTPGAGAIFRLNGGYIDTNVNGSDFAPGTPNPRITCPIQEVGPGVVSRSFTTSTNNPTTPPRDTTVIVNFSEPVSLDPGWVSITCGTSGVHSPIFQMDDADTVDIIPDFDYAAGELCTVTILATHVHDLDGVAPETLPADYAFSFTVSTGAAPLEGPEVHLAMGNPSDDAGIPHSDNNYILIKPEYSTSYNRQRGGPNWTSWHLSSDWTGTAPRDDSFRPDPQLPPDWYHVDDNDFSLSGFDRGHMTPSADRQFSLPINQATFLMTNMVPQSPDNNQGPWEAFESYLRTRVCNVVAGNCPVVYGDELYIVSGGLGTGGVATLGGPVINTLGGGKVTVPAYTWKVVLELPSATGDDAARVTAATRTIAILMPNVAGIRSNPWTNYLTTVDQIEALTGYDFFSKVPDAIENAIEAGINGVNPPGTAKESSSGNEDTQQSVTLEGVSPSNAALTYTIVTPPSSGSLSGTGANQTYTPVPDFNGTDTFTYKVNDGTGDSNTSTVTLTVLEVNDPPVAADDAVNTNANMPLVFSASDLAANDSAGPSNESTQTLTVASVTPGVNTHGTVSLNAGQVTYTPDAGYAGPGSFTYSVCDNGVTAGLSDQRCSSATVNVNVACVFSMTASNSGPYCDGTSIQLTSSTIAGVTYHWTGPNGFVSAQQNPSLPATVSASGTYTVTIDNGAGCSASAQTSVVVHPLPSAALNGELTTCAGVPVSIAAIVSGTGPITVRWSDGVIQSVDQPGYVTRTVAPASTTTLKISSVNDAYCSSVGTGQILVVVSPAATISHQPASTSVKAGSTASLTVSAPNASTFQWYEGASGDTSHPVASGSSTFTTLPLGHTSSYWVRVSGPCNSIDSSAAIVTVTPVRRHGVRM